MANGHNKQSGLMSSGVYFKSKMVGGAVDNAKMVYKLIKDTVRERSSFISVIYKK